MSVRIFPHFSDRNNSRRSWAPVAPVATIQTSLWWAPPMIIPEYLRAMEWIGVEKSCFEYSKEGDNVNIIIHCNGRDDDMRVNNGSLWILFMQRSIAWTVCNQYPDYVASQLKSFVVFLTRIFLVLKQGAGKRKFPRLSYCTSVLDSCSCQSNGTVWAIPPASCHPWVER